MKQVPNTQVELGDKGHISLTRCHVCHVRTRCTGRMVKGYLHNGSPFAAHSPHLPEQRAESGLGPSQAPESIGEPEEGQAVWGTRATTSARAERQ